MADPVRIATFNTELSRKGPGLLLRDILKGGDAQIDAVIALITEAAPDILVLQGIDYDLQAAALHALAYAINQTGPDYPHRFALPPNAGRQTSLDLDGNGKTGEARDAQGYGRFFGAGAMAILSRHPVLTDGVQDYTAMLWRDLPDAALPVTKDGPFPSLAAQQVQRLSSNGHWVVPIDVPDLGTATLLTFHATPPVFDGPEDRNGKRNHDEIMFWDHYLAGKMATPPENGFILLGGANLDPNRGDGLRSAIKTILSHPRLQDPTPDQTTAVFDNIDPLRVDYLLPSTDWRVVATGRAQDPAASRHSLIWVDLDR